MNAPAAGSVVRQLQGRAAVAAPMRLHRAALDALVESLGQRAESGTLGGMLLYRPPEPGAAVAVTPDEYPRRTEEAPWPDAGPDEWFLIVTGVDYPLVLCGPQPDPAGELTVQCSTEPSSASHVAELVLRLVARALPDQPALSRTAPSPAGLCDSLVVMLLERLDAAQRGSAAADADILDVVEADRSRTAAALHDGPVQELTAALLFLDGATLGSGAIDADLVRRGSEALRSAVLSCRAMMDNLAPPRGEAHELPARIERLATATATAATSTLQPAAELRIADPALALDIYRVVETLLDNVRRHAGGALHRISLRRAGDHIELVVADRGPGMVPARQDGIGGLGLAARRVGRHGGTMRIESSERGTIVTSLWPAPAAVDP